MQTEIDIYGHELKLSRKIERIKKLKSISEKAKKKILQFQEDCLANGLSAARILRYLDDLPRIAQLLDNKFEKPSVDDIKKVVREIDKKDISPVSKQEFKKTIKKFYKWLNGSNEYPSCVQWIKSSRKLNNNKLPEELLTEEEVKKMINASGNPRDRAIIATLWESGCRAGEMLLLRIKHVSFEETLTKIVVQGKTGMRRIPLLDSTPYLTDWIENHPLKEN
ncbi:MAG: tyrosine-type recombinase/integrase, partial [Candidatus Thermoplasmatota archaeon]|nr:tyrosine-type recombinase/integrase [Candidatus Thermoplasmatota archaeon]